MAVTTAKPAIYTPQQLASMSPSAQASYLGTLPPAQRAELMAQVQALRSNQNLDFMTRSIRKYAPLPNASGAGFTQNYVTGTTMIWDFPVISGAVAAEVLLEFNLSVTPATGTGAAYALNPSAPFSAWQEVDVTYNGTQVRIPVYTLKDLQRLRGFERPGPGVVIAGQSVTDFQNYLFTSNPLVVGSANTWAGLLRLPLNPLGKNDFRGVIPINAQGTKAQLKLFCAQTPMGPDPLLSPVRTTAGTGAAVTITGTVKCYVEYLDGMTGDGPQTRLALDLTGQPTVQMLLDQDLNPLSAGLLQPRRLVNLLRHAYIISYLIDGQQSSVFSTLANTVGLQLSMDDAGSNPLKFYGVNSNVNVGVFFDQVRQVLGQDIDEGVIPWWLGPLEGIQNPSAHNSGRFFDMTPGHWVAATHAYQMTAVGAVAGMTPRVTTVVISENPRGFAST